MSKIISMQAAAKDYQLVCRNLAFLRENWRDQPSLEALAERNGLSAAHLQRLFMRWAGLSPKAFLQVISDDRIGHALQLAVPQVLYGRRNTLTDLQQRPLAEIVEILPPEKPPLTPGERLPG